MAKKKADWERDGYVFEGASQCRGCGQMIDWVLTPTGRRMPMDDNGDGTCTPHFATCPQARDFRRSGQRR